MMSKGMIETMSTRSQLFMYTVAITCKLETLCSYFEVVYQIEVFIIVGRGEVNKDVNKKEEVHEGVNNDQRRIRIYELFIISALPYSKASSAGVWTQVTISNLKKFENSKDLQSYEEVPFRLRGILRVNHAFLSVESSSLRRRGVLIEVFDVVGLNQQPPIDRSLPLEHLLH
jgi:hypothetical protein